MISRGPNGNHTYRSDNLRLHHTRLSISHTSKAQPATFHDKYTIAFNGELYHPAIHSGNISEIDFIAKKYDEFGVDYASKLVGEFSIIIIDHSRSIFHISRDYFGTKPLFAISRDGVLEVASISDQIRSTTSKHQPTLIPSNKTLTYCLQSLDLISERTINTLSSKNNNIRSKWTNLIRQEFINMWPLDSEVFIPLSSGHDSGLLAALADKLGYRPTFYLCPRGENLDILSKRIQFLQRRDHKIIIFDLKDTLEHVIRNELYLRADHIHYVDEAFRAIDPVRDDPAPIGLATIYKHARANGRLVGLSGQGGDEIYSGGYGSFGPIVNVSNQLCEDKDKKPSEMFPWRHLLNGKMQQYLLKEEAIASVFSLETRYPLLAIKPFLSFLYDYQPEYTISYKGPIEAELKSLEFPYDITRLKRGFNPFSMDRSEAFLDYFSEIVIQAEEVWL